MSLIPLRATDLVFEDRPWVWAEHEEARIAAHWAKKSQDNAALFDGRVLVTWRYEIVDGVLCGACLETDFSKFLAWRDFGFPDTSIVNVFAMAALRAESGPLSTREAAREAHMRIEIAKTAICGTDMHIYKWDAWAQNRVKTPRIFGHEFAGEVVEAGREVTELAPGDFVAAETHITCGHCYQCRTGQAHMCERTRILGVDRDGPGAGAEPADFYDFERIRMLVGLYAEQERLWQDYERRLAAAGVSRDDPMPQAGGASCGH